MSDGDAIDETGTLMREGGGFMLRCDGGRRLGLELGRTPVDHVGKRVRITGRLLGPGRAEVETIARAG